MEIKEQIKSVKSKINDIEFDLDYPDDNTNTIQLEEELKKQEAILKSLKELIELKKLKK